jgi:hypothetical protein
MSNREVVTRETDARFWSQTGYKPGQKLDPAIPTDKAMVPVWLDIFKKVQRAADAGTLVTTYDHPEVAQHLSDAAVAGRAAAAHIDSAAASPDAKTAQDNIVAAATAQGISTQKAREAAAKQPTTVDPKLVRDAGQQTAKVPPPPHAPANEHIAHAHAREHAYEHAQAVHAEAPARAALYKETNVRFWRQTNYKPGQKLDMAIEQDRRMAKVWMDIFHQVQREAEAGTLVFSEPGAPPLAAPPVAPSPPMRIPPVAPLPPGPPRLPVGPPVAPLPPGPPRLPVGPPVYPRPPMMPPVARPPMMPPVARPPMMPPVARPQMGPQMGPQMAPPGAQAAPPSTQPPPTPTPEVPGGEPGLPPEPPGAVPPGVPPEEKPGIGKYIAIGVAVLAGGGLLYYTTTREPSRKGSSRPRSRSRSPRAPMPSPMPSPMRSTVRTSPSLPLLAAESEE